MGLNSGLNTEESLSDSLKRKWIKNLESGKYTQGRFSLKTTPVETNGPIKHCCLGVLCETAKLELGTSKKETLAYAFCNSKLAESTTDACVNANDTLQLSFEEIALSFRGYWNIWN